MQAAELFCVLILWKTDITCIMYPVSAGVQAFGDSEGKGVAVYQGECDSLA